MEKDKLLFQQKEQEAQQLKELDEVKSRLFTNITHEFRTPLTVIMGMNENITGHKAEKGLIRRNSQNLLRLVNQLLDLSKADVAGLPIEKISGDIIAYLRYLTESFYSLATDKGVQLTFYSEISNLETTYDETKVQQIFYNLLSNAIKFTEAKGEVTFRVQKVEEAAQPFLKIKIQDTGSGIAEADLPRIFDRFYQADNSTTRRAEGTGIGLALTKQLVELLDGKIEVSSQIGVGTEFIVYLPIEDVLNQPSRYGGLQSKNELTLDALEPTDVTANADLPILLIIEDNRDVAQYIKSILQEKYTIHLAKDGKEGIKKALKLVPDIIISDVMMPHKDGYEVCETLKQDTRTSHVPIILLTAKATHADKITGLQYGADAYLNKPFHKTELLVRLEKLTALRITLQKHYAQSIIETPAIELPNEETIFLKQLRDLVLAQLDNPDFSVADLGKSMHLSDMQIYRKLKALTNQTPSTFIRSVRLQRGKELLKNTQLSIAEIAYTTGFNQPSYFSRSFQKTFGVSPREFRK
ncbi:MAG: ATP-binding protein [Saprospiraceae bacterium]